MHQPLHRLAQRRVIGAGPSALREDVVMQVAVAQMPKAVDPHIAQRPQRRPGARDEVRYRPQRQRDIVAGNGPDPPVRLGDHLAQVPERIALRLRGGDQPVGDQPGVHPFGKQLLQRRHRRQACGQAKVNQHHPLRRAGKGLAHLWQHLGQKLQSRPADQLEGRNQPAQPRLGPRQQRQRGGRVRHHQQGCPLGGRHRMQPQAGRRDHAQRAFCPDQQVPQVIAAVVLAQPLQPVQHRPVRQDRLDPQAQVARIAIAQHVDPARIGRQHPTHARRPLRSQRQRKPPGHGLRMGLSLGQRHPGLDHHRIPVREDRPQRRHAVQRQDQRRGAALHQLPAHKAGPAAPGDDAHPGPGAGPDDHRHLLNPARPGDSRPHALPAPARFAQKARLDRAQRALRQARGKIGQKGRPGGDHAHGPACRSRPPVQAVSSATTAPAPGSSAATAGRSAPPPGCWSPPARPERHRPYRPETLPARHRKTSASAAPGMTAGA